MGVKWHLTAILILVFISLIAKEFEHLLIWELAICFSSSMKCLLMSSAYFPVELFIFLSLICSSLYINLLSIKCIAKYLSQLMACLFIFSFSFLLSLSPVFFPSFPPSLFYSLCRAGSHSIVQDGWDFTGYP